MLYSQTQKHLTHVCSIVRLRNTVHVCSIVRLGNTIHVCSIVRLRNTIRVCSIVSFLLAVARVVEISAIWPVRIEPVNLFAGSVNLQMYGIWYRVH